MFLYKFECLLLFFSNFLLISALKILSLNFLYPKLPYTFTFSFGGQAYNSTVYAVGLGCWIWPRSSCCSYGTASLFQNGNRGKNYNLHGFFIRWISFD